MYNRRVLVDRNGMVVDIVSDDDRHAILMAAERTADPDNDHRCPDRVSYRDDHRHEKDD